MIRNLPRAVARTVPRRAVRSRGFAAHAEHVEQLVLEGKPSKEWLEKKAAVEHHAAGGLLQYILLFSLTESRCNSQRRLTCGGKSGESWVNYLLGESEP